jgi:hypothetical protein
MIVYLRFKRVRRLLHRYVVPGLCAALGSAASLIGTAVVSSASPPGPPVISPQQPPAVSQPQGSPSPTLQLPRLQAGQTLESILEIPQLVAPEMPAMPLPLASPSIPKSFNGCWEGNPGGFDEVATDSIIKNAGSPGRITFCYHEGSVEVREAEIRVPPLARLYDIAINFGLSYDTFEARGVKTEICLVTPDTVRSRTTLNVVVTPHLLFVIPVGHVDEPMLEDEVTQLTGPDTLRVKARLLLTAFGIHLWGTWHAEFHRVS